MTRMDLNVPYAEKDEAKALGARWDPQKKTWYIPEGVEIGMLKKWLPPPVHAGLEHKPEFRIRSPFYYIAESLSHCWKCSARSPVFSFILPEEHEEFRFFEDEDFKVSYDMGEWQTHGYRGTVSNVRDMSTQVTSQIRRFTQDFKLAYSRAAGTGYFMNHCQHCTAKLGDFFMHCEPGGAFFPTSPEQASKITLFRVSERFDSNCGVSYATDDFINDMRVIESA